MTIRTAMLAAAAMLLTAGWTVSASAAGQRAQSARQTTGAVNPDRSADQLNAQVLSNMRSGQSGAPTGAPSAAPTGTGPSGSGIR